MMRYVAPIHLLLAIAAVTAAQEPQPVKHQVTGLFSPDRQADLRKVMETLPEIKLVSIDYENAEATFLYDLKKAFNADKAEQVVERFNNLLRLNSRDTFGIKPLRTTPKEQLTLVEIPVVGLDCKGCAWAAYGSVYRIDGVETATVSFKEGWVKAQIDPAKTNRAALETALKERGVQIKAP